jgi:hypothetical protein
MPATLITGSCVIASHAEELVHQPIPALLARISRRPKLSVISLAAASAEASSVKSICMTARPPLIRSFPDWMRLQPLIKILTAEDNVVIWSREQEAFGAFSNLIN